MGKTLKNMIEAAKVGGLILNKYFGQSLEVSQKTNAADFKTKADLESEEAIIYALKKDFPDYSIYSEEEGSADNGSEYTFVIDPLDGTNNFVLGIPNFSVSIGLLFGKEIIAGVIYSPVIDNIYCAEKGKGAYCDGRKLKVSGETDIKRATICCNNDYKNYFTNKAQQVTIDLYAKETKRVMHNWSPTFDFCMLASGKAEAVINNNAELYDFSAGKLICREAGALITDFDGNPETDDTNRIFIASNSAPILKEILDVLKEYKK